MDGMSAMAIIGLITSVAIIVFGVMMGLAILGVVEDGMAWLTAGSAVLLKILDKAFKAIKSRTQAEKPKKPQDQAGFALVRVLALVAVIAALLLLGACTTTYTGATSKTSLQAYGSDGTTAVLDVDGSEVCRVTGTKSTLRVDRRTARRICLAFGDVCKWGPQ